MSITVGELLELPHLQLRLLAGAAGLAHEISWVHASDLPEPWGWLGLREMLLTNGTGLSADGTQQARFVERLAEAGCCGLGLGLGMSGPPLAPALCQRADSLALPVVTVPYSMPFTAVVRAVADANLGEEARQLGKVSRLYELLRTSVLTGRAGPELFGRLGEELSARLCLVDPETGLSVFGDGAATCFAESLAASYAAHGNAVPGVLRLTRPGAAGTDQGAVAVAVPGNQPAVLVAEPVGGALPSTVLLRHVATAGALEIAQLAAAQERQRKLGEQLLGQLFDLLPELRASAQPGGQAALLLPRSTAEARAVVERILGPLIRHDAEHGTAYLGTLRAMLDHDRSWQLAASALHIHKQTLGYRIRKIEQLTGRGVSRTEHLAEWWFALRAYDLLAGVTGR